MNYAKGDTKTKARPDWKTPSYIFEQLNREFKFTLDAAADDQNHLCDKYFTKEDDGLLQDWTGERVFCNPPYGTGIGNWLKKAKESNAEIVVFLLPVNTSTNWFHDYCYGNEIRFIRRRLKFDDCNNRAPFSSMIVIMRKEWWR